MFLKFFLFITSFLLLFSVEGVTPLNVISLSAPVTHHLFFCGALKNPPIRAISSLHGLSSEQFLGDILPGGLFVSARYFDKYSSPIVFYDENRVQAKILKALPKVRSLPVVTRGKTPFEVFYETSLLIKKVFPLKDQHLSERIATIKKRIDEHPPFSRPILFFLGAINEGSRLPQLLMVEDGPPAYWIHQKKLKSYPSSLAYVPWSKKILEEMKGNGPLVMIGLTGQNRDPKQHLEEIRFEKREEGKNVIINIYSLAPMMPGLGQIFFMDWLAQHFEQIIKK